MKMLGSIIKANNEDLFPENKVLGVGGSPRKNGNSDVLLGVLSNVVDGGYPSA